ncbi:MAG: acyl carrier protein [Lachnospiraceae bacterium]|nr:acyl carrier protein [Lachnospiraceae bacterium]
MKERVLQVLRDYKSAVDYEKETALISGGIIDSMEWVELIEKLEKAFQVTIPLEQLTAENFNSADAIVALMEELTKNA